MGPTKTAVLGTILVAALAPAAFAQQNATPSALGAAEPEIIAKTMVDCDADFKALDVNADGYLSQAEAELAYARSRVGDVTVGNQGISKDEYAALCASPDWAENIPEEGAPFEGANSFSEEQARDRAVAWNVIAVSALTLDEQGIWRGRGTLNDETVSIAIDYKGNVVMSPATP